MDGGQSSATAVGDGDDADEPGGRWSILVLGPMVVEYDGVAVKVGPAMVRRLLALLALHSGLVVSRQDIVDALWDGNPPSTYVNLIHVYASRLRAQLRDGSRDGERVAITSSDHGGYQLHLDAEAVDLARFDQLLQRARRAVDIGDLTVAIGLYEAALRCWRGPVLAEAESGFERLPVVVDANQRRIAGVVEYAQLCGTLGRHELAVEALRGASKTAPLHEGLHAQLMLALANAGDRASALTAYEEARRRLADELGVDPGTRLRSIHLQLLREGDEQRPEDDLAAAVSDPVDVAVRETQDAPPVAPAAPEPPASDTPEALLVTPLTGRPTSPARHRPVNWVVAAASLVAVISLVVGLAWLGDQRGRRPTSPLSATSSGSDAVTTPVHWHWAYADSLGSTETGVQWASASISGVSRDSCAGFRLRVGASPVGEGDEQGLLAAVCSDKWEIEARDEDFMHVDVDLAAAGTLRVAVSDANILTITYNGSVLATRQLQAGAYAGRHIVPAIYQGDSHVTLVDIRSNATPPTPTTPAPTRS